MSQVIQTVPDTAVGNPSETTSKKLIYAVAEQVEKVSYLNRPFEGSEYALVVVHSLEQLNERMLQHTPTALIVDADMLARFSDKQVKAKVPVIVVSGNDDFETRMAAVRINSDAFLCHPVDAVELFRKLEELTSSAGSQAYRVLVIDDEIGTAELASIRLRQAGIKAEGLSEPTKVMHAIQNFKPDLILMDLYMPGCSGIELTRLIKQHEQYAHIPVIYLSAETDSSKQLEAVNAGGEQFLTKPVNVEEMVKVVRNCIKKSRVSEQKEAPVVRIDEVTGLNDRLQFISELQAVINDPDKYHHSILLYINLPGYIKLKGKDGRNIANAYLKHAVAKLVRTCDRKHFRLARVAEDSIGIISYGNDRQNARNIPAKVQQCLMTVSEDSKHAIKAYIGAYLIGDVKVDAQQAMYQSILACEMSQQENRDGIHIRGLDDDNQNEEEIEKSSAIIIKRAIAANNVKLIYQPIVTLGGGVQEKYEIYMRLLDSEGRELPPDRCIPVAEKYGKMADIDRMVFTNALEMLAQSRQTVKSTVFFVKVSAQTMKDKTFPNWIYGELNRRKLPGSSIVVEIREKDAAEDKMAAISFCGTMKAINCGLVLEHFGTQLNSVALLKSLPVDYVKLDGSYMVDLWRNQGNQDTVRSMTREAHKKGALVIASFVEDANSYDVLWNTGVNLLQGNFFQAPGQENSYDFSSLPRISKNTQQHDA
jgi:EAL domain-containing protein (putative c-di-GMP-specific phosphodiesterase class I)/DNA-binding response OmpR family regulator